jgi:hypothetical protein
MVPDREPAFPYLGAVVRQVYKPAVKPKGGEQLSTAQIRFVGWLVLPPRAPYRCLSTSWVLISDEMRAVSKTSSCTPE